MLYDGAIRFLHQASAAMEDGRRELARERMRRAEAILDELNVVLDMSQGEIPARLRSIYLFCKRELREANLRREPARIGPVIRLLRELREAWASACAVAERGQASRR